MLIYKRQLNTLIKFINAFIIIIIFNFIKFIKIILILSNFIKYTELERSIMKTAVIYTNKLIRS